jgi:hypothetical protein
VRPKRSQAQARDEKVRASRSGACEQRYRWHDPSLPTELEGQDLLSAYDVVPVSRLNFLSPPPPPLHRRRRPCSSCRFGHAQAGASSGRQAFQRKRGPAAREQAEPFAPLAKTSRTVRSFHSCRQAAPRCQQRNADEDRREHSWQPRGFEVLRAATTYVRYNGRKCGQGYAQGDGEGLQDEWRHQSKRARVGSSK